MRTEGPLTDADRSSGAVAFAAIGGMLATGIAWVNGLALLPGLGWGLIWGVIGLLVGAVVYYGWME
jgi:polyferredoxin